MNFNRIQRAVLNQLGVFLPEAKNYEIRFPVKPSVRVRFPHLADNEMDAVQDVHYALRESGLSYYNMYVDGSVIVVEGIHFASPEVVQRRYKKAA